MSALTRPEGFGFSGKGSERLFGALFVLTSALVLDLNHLIDPDLFWHLRGGMDIVRAGKAVLPDSWNYLFQGGFWVNQQWVTEAIFFKSFDWGGFWGLLILKGAIAACVVSLILAMLKKHHPAVRYACATAFVLCDFRHFLFRTHIMSFLCIALLLYLLENVPSKSRLPWIFLLFAAWANLHTVFGLGLMVLGLYAGVRWLEGLLIKSPSGEGSCNKAPASGSGPQTATGGQGEQSLSGEGSYTFLKRLKIDIWEWVSVPAACVATLINPYGIGVWQTAFATFGREESFLISEWWPIWKHHPIQLVGFYVLVAVLAVLCCMFPKRVHLPSLAASVLLAAMTVKSARFSSDFVLPSLPLLACLLDALMERLSDKMGPRKLSLAIPAITAILVSAAALSLSYTMANPIAVPSTFKRIHYPVKAVGWMKLKGLKGKIFSEYGWGGYLCWAMPESRTGIDGRTSVLLFPEGHTKGWRDCIDIFPGWREYLEQGRPDFVLISNDDLLAGQLAIEPGWQKLYEDEMAVLFGRAAPALPTGQIPTSQNDKQ